jgi:hypothetical protein
MSLGGCIFAGDLARALVGAGDSGGANWPSIARMLGFRLEAGREEPRGREAVALEQRSLPSIGETQRSPEPPGSPPPARSGEMGALLDFEIERSTAPPESIPPAPPPVSEEPADAKPIGLAPLFNGLWERGVLLEAAGMPRPEGELAIVEAVRLAATGEGWRDLPMEKIQSVSKGCQMLVDAGIGMQPFIADTRQMVRSMSKVVGARHVSVQTFVDCPSRGVLLQAYQDEAYRAPDNGAMVVALSDLCAGGPRAAIREAGPEEWLPVAKFIRDAGSMLVVLNPYPPDRWPARLAGRFPIIYWHASTRLADVRKTRRRFRS